MVKYSEEFRQESHNGDKMDNVVEEDMDSRSTLNVLDLFCGCGGMSKGLEDAGLNVIAGIDIWDRAIESYKKNFKHLAVCGDLTKLSPYIFNSKYNKCFY